MPVVESSSALEVPEMPGASTASETGSRLRFKDTGHGPVLDAVRGDSDREVLPMTRVSESAGVVRAEEWDPD